MNILVTSAVDLRKTAPNRLHHFIKFLYRKHNISAICVNDYWKAEQVDTDKIYQDFREILDNIEICYITDKKINPVKQELLSPILMNLPKGDFDVIFNSDALISGYYIAKKLKLPMIYDFSDDMPEMIANSPQIPNYLRFLGKLMGKKMLEKNMAISKRITCISRTLQNTYSIPVEKFELVPNGVDTEMFKEVKSDLKQKLGLENYFVLGYVGVLREWVDLEPVYDAVRNFENVKLLVVGEEGMLKENTGIVKKYRVEDKVIFAGTVPYIMVPSYISAMDACLIPFKQKNAISQNAAPLKLFEYMACEKPVISTKLRGVVEAVGDRVLYANSAEDYVDQIKNLINNQDSTEELRKNRRQFVIENYDWEKIVGRVEAVLLEVALEVGEEK